MKALNRAIARTVSQLARYGREGGHVPMLMALENHLDALLTMERKQLEAAGMKFATLTGAGAVDVFASNLSALQQQLAEKATLLQPHANDNAQAVTSAPQEPPSLPPEKWREGDLLLCVDDNLKNFTKGMKYPIKSIGLQNDGHCFVIDDEVRTYNIAGALLKSFRNYERLPSKQDTQPAPDVIDMTDPASWQEGDIVVRTSASNASFLNGEHCTVTENNENMVRIANKKGNRSVTYPHGTQHDGAENYFKWLRHGESEVAA